jgi:Protein of unknown function (DUF3060)
MNSEDDPEARIRELEQPLADAARASEVGANPSPGKWAAPPDPGFRPPQPPMPYGSSYGGPSPWGAPRPPSRNRIWWVLAAFFIVGTIAIPLGFAVFGVNRATHGGFVTITPYPSTPSISPSAAPPSASAAQPPGAAPSTSASQAPAGATVTIAGIKENQTVACNQNSVNISGISNKVVITGHCATLHVSGVQNSITVDSVDAIEVSGFNNQVTYHTGSPTIDKSGDGNVVQQG